MKRYAIASFDNRRKYIMVDRKTQKATHFYDTAIEAASAAFTRTPSGYQSFTTMLMRNNPKFVFMDYFESDIPITTKTYPEYFI